MSILSRFFQFLSKTDRRLIIHCTDYSVKTQVTNGVFVLLTATFAFLSGMYAIHTTFKDFRIAIPIGLLYATVIAFIDREIVSTSNRWATLSRLPLAFAIGMVISVPLEMRLFATRIDQELRRSNVQENKAAQDQMENDQREFQNRITVLEGEKATYRKNIDEAGLAMQDEITGNVREGRSGTGIAGKGQAYEAAEAQLKRNQELLALADTELIKLTQQQSAVQARITETYNRSAIPKVEDLLARYEAMETVKRSSASAIYLTWGIRLLIILLEMSPALMKLLQSDNEYNVALEGNRRVNIARVIAMANDQIDQITLNPRTAPKPTLLEQLREHPFTS
jgi:hypothetical protein